MSIIKWSVIILLMGLASCKKDDEIVTLSNVEYIDFGTCFLDYRIAEEEVLIKDSATYAAFEATLRSPWNPLDFTDSCSLATLPAIDFNHYFLLGKKTVGQGCEATYSRSITYNKTQKQYTYTVFVNYSGDCINPEISNYNWAVVPKKDEKYQVIFKVL